MAKFIFLALGNPGEQYEKTRHNIGWMALDSLVRDWSDPTVPAHWKYEKKIQGNVIKFWHGNNEIIGIKPDTFMNLSGQSAAAAAKWFLDIDPTISENQDFSNLIVFHDDLDLESGSYKLKFASGPRVHNGYNSVVEHLHSNKFWTVRIGIDGRNGDRTLPGRAYVLQKAPTEEMQKIQQAIQLLTEEIPYIVLQ